MGTSLTPEFWERFTVLLVLAVGVVCVLTAVFDALAVRLLRRRVRRPVAHAASPSTLSEDGSSVGW